MGEVNAKGGRGKDEKKYGLGWDNRAESEE